MSTLIADTIKARSNFPIGYATDINMSETDSRSVKDAIGAAGNTATKTSLGVVQIGDGLDVTPSTDTTPGLLSVAEATETTIGGVTIGDGVSVDEGEISVPFYAEVSDSEPENHNKLWIDTSDCYNFGGDEFTIENYNRYSTDEEIVCGCWINGKPIYRSCVSVSALKNKGTTTVDLSSYNIDQVTALKGVEYNKSAGIFRPLPYLYTDSTWNVVLYITSYKLTITTQSDRTDESVYVFIEYTKTTDAENSFDESMMFSDTLQNEPTDAQYEEVWL